MQKIIEEYREKRASFEAFATKLEKLLQELLYANGINFHSVTSRTKTEKSLLTKISSSKYKKYTSLSDITDIVGLRVITYFEDDVDKVVSIINSEFLIDKVNSTDKRALYAYDRFGYLSYHLVTYIGNKRIKLKEYKQFDGVKAEIQIRSILQHAWAEIEHDIGYKTSFQVPDHLKRKLSRLAGLLEIADEEFSGLKSAILSYRKSLKNKSILLDAELNTESLVTFIKTSEDVHRIDKFFCNLTGHKLSKETYTTLNDEIRYLVNYRIKTISELQTYIRKNSSRLESLIHMWVSIPDDKEDKEKDLDKHVGQGISIFYVNYLLVAENYDLEGIQKYFIERKLGPGDCNENAKKLQQIYKKLP